MTKKVLTFATFLALVFCVSQHSVAYPSQHQQLNAKACDVPVPQPPPFPPMQPIPGQMGPQTR
jgi:hypothetical protein